MADQAIDIVNSVTGAARVRSGDTITFQYAPGRAFASYAGQGPAYLGVRAMQAIYTQEVDFSLAYGVSSIVVTYLGVSPIPANTPVSLHLPVRDTSGAPVDAGGYTPPDAVFDQNGR